MARLHDVLVPPWRTLLEVLRENLGLTGTKRSCQEGQCGTCTVLIDGKAVNSCLYLAVEAQGKDILTIEGLGKATAVCTRSRNRSCKKAECNADFARPDLVLATKSLLDDNPDPSEDEIREAIVGHLCRCTGYVQIVEAIQDAAREMARQGRR